MSSPPDPVSSAAAGEQVGASSQVSVILARAGRGDTAAVRDLLPLVYEELRRRARLYVSAKRPGYTLQPTALVHEAFAELAGGGMDWQSSRHFFNAAALAMRQILVDYDRARGARKRGGDARRVNLEDVDQLPGARQVDPDETDWEALDNALQDLKREDERRHQVVMYRYFAGLSEEKTAELMGLSEKTVQRDWKVARLFLLARLRADDKGVVDDGSCPDGAR